MYYEIFKTDKTHFFGGMKIAKYFTRIINDIPVNSIISALYVDTTLWDSFEKIKHLYKGKKIYMKKIKKAWDSILKFQFSSSITFIWSLLKVVYDTNNITIMYRLFKSF